MHKLHWVQQCILNEWYTFGWLFSFFLSFSLPLTCQSHSLCAVPLFFPTMSTSPSTYALQYLNKKNDFFLSLSIFSCNFVSSAAGWLTLPFCPFFIINIWFFISGTMINISSVIVLSKSIYEFAITVSNISDGGRAFVGCCHLHRTTTSFFWSQQCLFLLFQKNFVHTRIHHRMNKVDACPCMVDNTPNETHLGAFS